MAHTYAKLGVSPAVYHEIKEKLTEAGYAHAFMEDGAIDMHGLAITISQEDAEIFEKIKDAVRDCVENCKANGHWYGATEKLSDEELATELYIMSGIPQTYLAADLVAAVRAVRSEL